MTPGCSGSVFTWPLSPAEVNALRQRVGILEGQLQRLQNAFSQYKKGEFLDLTLSQAPSMDLRLSLGLACSLLGLGLNWTCWDRDWDWT